MTEQLAKQEISQVTAGCVYARGEHNLEDESKEDSGSDYVSAESEDDQDKISSIESKEKCSNVSSNSEIKRHSQPKSIVIPSTEEELEVPGGSNDNYSFVPTHPGLPVMPSVPPQSPQEKAQIAAREGKVWIKHCFNTLTFIVFGVYIHSCHILLTLELVSTKYFLYVSHLHVFFSHPSS